MGDALGRPKDKHSQGNYYQDAKNETCERRQSSPRFTLLVLQAHDANSTERDLQRKRIV